MDEELNSLFFLAQNGDDEAFCQLFELYKPIIYTFRRKYYLRDLDEDDWLQESRIIFYKVLKKYNSARGLTLGNYFKKLLDNRIVTLIRKQQTLKRRADFYCISLDEVSVKGYKRVHDDKESYPSIDDQLILRESFAEYSELLSKFERDVIDCYLHGHGFSQIEEILGMPRVEVQDAYHRGKKKLSRHLKKVFREP